MQSVSPLRLAFRLPLELSPANKVTGSAGRYNDHMSEDALILEHLL